MASSKSRTATAKPSADEIYATLFHLSTEVREEVKSLGNFSSNEGPKAHEAKVNDWCKEVRAKGGATAVLCAEKLKVKSSYKFHHGMIAGGVGMVAAAILTNSPSPISVVVVAAWAFLGVVVRVGHACRQQLRVCSWNPQQVDASDQGRFYRVVSTLVFQMDVLRSQRFKVAEDRTLLDDYEVRFFILENVFGLIKAIGESNPDTAGYRKHLIFLEHAVETLKNLPTFGQKNG